MEGACSVFKRLGDEYKMVSDDGCSVLSLSRTDRDGTNYFEIVIPNGRIDFEAELDVEPTTKWRVLRIKKYQYDAKSKKNILQSGNAAPEAVQLIRACLGDYGIFFGQKAGKVGVEFEYWI